MTSANHPLRQALASDVDAILALERATDQAPHWPRAVYADMLDSSDPQRCLIVAKVNEVLIGFAVGLIADSVAELESVVVASVARRAGVGRALCNAVFDWCRSQGATEIVLEVRAASDGATALYTGLGFVQTGRRLRYYRDPEEDAVVMQLTLV